MLLCQVNDKKIVRCLLGINCKLWENKSSQASKFDLIDISIKFIPYCRYQLLKGHAFIIILNYYYINIII